MLNDTLKYKRDCITKSANHRMAAHVAAPGVGGDPGKPPPDRRQPAPLWRKAAVVAAAVVFLTTLAWVSVVELPDRIDDGRAELAASECEATASVLMGYANMLVSTTRIGAARHGGMPS